MSQKAQKLLEENEKLKERIMGYSVAETEEVKQVPVLSIVEQNGAGSVENLN